MIAPFQTPSSRESIPAVSIYANYWVVKLRLFRTNTDLFPIVDAKISAASVGGMKADEAQGKAAEMKGEAKGKAEEVKGEVKGQVNEKL